MKNIAITGASGFVGKNLISYLEDRGKNVEILDLRKNGWAQKITANSDTIIHLAGKAHDLKKTSEPKDYYLVNYELTKQLYNAFLKSEAKKFIFVSSVKAVADYAKEILTEETTPNPKTDYGKSKLMAEGYIQSQPLPTGKSFYILRPCMIHGPQSKGNINLLYNFVKKKIPYPLAAFKNERSFLSVKNLCFVIDELISNTCETGVYNVADDVALSTNEVISILGSSMNVKPRLWNVPQAMIIFLAKIGDLLHFSLTTDRLNKLTENYVVSNKKIKHAINKELPLTAFEGFKITANSFSNN